MPTGTSQFREFCVRMTLGMLCLVSGAGGACQSAGEPSAAEETSAAPAPSRELEFFDALDRRPVATQDDLLQGMLLVRNGSAPADHAGRVAEARRLGIVGASYSRPPRSAVTVEQASAAAAGAIGTRDFSAWQGDATRWAKTERLVPQDVNGTDQLSGGQLLAILGGVSDLLVSRPAPAPDAASSGTDAFDAFTPVTTKPASAQAPAPMPATPAPVPAAAAPADAPKPRPEPLPEMKLVEAPAPAKPPAAAPPPPEPVKVDTTAQERPAVTPAPARPLPIPKPTGNPWASGRPVGS